jgi:hypothetical protein
VVIRILTLASSQIRDFASLIAPIVRSLSKRELGSSDGTPDPNGDHLGKGTVEDIAELFGHLQISFDIDARRNDNDAPMVKELVYHAATRARIGPRTPALLGSRFWLLLRRACRQFYRPWFQPNRNSSEQQCFRALLGALCLLPRRMSRPGLSGYRQRGGKIIRRNPGARAADDPQGSERQFL